MGMIRIVPLDGVQLAPEIMRWIAVQESEINRECERRVRAWRRGDTYYPRGYDESKAATAADPFGG